MKKYHYSMTNRGTSIVRDRSKPFNPSLPNTNLITEYPPCKSKGIHHFSNASTDKEVAWAGMVFQVRNIPILKCEKCKHISFTEQSVKYIDECVNQYKRLVEYRISTKRKLIEFFAGKYNVFDDYDDVQ